MTKLYLYKTIDGRFLANMDSLDANGSQMVGAVIPGEDGNHYRHLLLSAHRDRTGYMLGAEGWLEWLVTGLLKARVSMEEDFAFDPETVKIVEFVER